MADPKPEPVRVKMYGLFRITKARYIRQLVMTGMMAVCLLAGWMMIPKPDLSQVAAPVFVDADGHPIENDPNKDRPWTSAPDHLMRLLQILSYLPWLIGAILALAAVEATFVLRRFAQKEEEVRLEAERKAAGPPKTEQTVTTTAEKTETVNGKAVSSGDPPQLAAGQPGSSTS